MLSAMRCLLLTLSLVLGLAAPAAALDAGQAGTFVENVADRATAVLGGEGNVGEQRAQIRDILLSAFDLTYIGQLALGPPYRTLSADQRAAYDSAFQQYVLATYARRIGDYGGEQIEVVGAQSAGSQDVKVQTRLVGPRIREPVGIDWRVRDRSGTPKIIDVEIEGVSMTISQRSEFASIVQQRGVDGLIAMLEERAVSGS